MDGVTILNTIECGGFSVFWLVLTIAFASFMCAFIVLFFVSLEQKSGAVCVICFLYFLICGFSIYAAAANINAPHYNKYEVLVDSDVSFYEFTQKYEVVDQDGNIYTVIERNNEG